jgi:hypothetical protein
MKKMVLAIGIAAVVCPHMYGMKGVKLVKSDPIQTLLTQHENTFQQEDQKGFCNIKRNHFTAEEDKLIIFLVEQYGTNNWKKIAKGIHGRTAKQLRERYNQYLSTNINKALWTPEEDQLLLSLVNQVGPQWAYMRQFFTRRNNIQIKNRWNNLHKKKIRYENIIYNVCNQYEDDSQNENKAQIPSVYNFFKSVEDTSQTRSKI